MRHLFGATYVLANAAMKARFADASEAAASGSFEAASGFIDKDTNIYANTYKDTSRKFMGFWHLMKKWKGSVTRLIWHDLLIFCLAYALISVLYREFVTHNERIRESFELICVYSSR